MTDLTTRPCGICGEPVQYANSPSLGFHLVQYHDCKPVPGARLDEAKAEIADLKRACDAASLAIDHLLGPDGRNYVTRVEAQREQARALLREGLDTGRHCCADRADCPRCAWEEKVHTLLDSNARLKPVVRSLRVVLPVNAQKRYLRPHSNAEWFESDDPNGPWTLVPVQA